ncbi:bacterial Ig-like domain-containing protein [Ammoniphilus sp. YIM 78166]|uniref:bacterial Ig-like domain-containing protein n=1 Tax=Ammoniphilus sp. YIM 78166 TaxID=1644106 RepID=UPI001F0E5C7F|nr:bacterial Ig-like domain-containing protein [Ammoniphilus sp. YIM 78166]
MQRLYRMLACVLSCLLVFSSLPWQAFAEEPAEAPDPMIDIASDWKGSVFGDVGGQDKISQDNFTIKENGDGTVTLRSANDRGKISSTSEGIAYYFKEVPTDNDFELSVTAQVYSWTPHNQVSFGIMLRNDVLDNTHLGSTYTGDYIAVGALDQQMKGFYKQGGTLVKGLDFEAAPPAAGQEYRLSIKKTGSLYVIKNGDEVKVIEGFNGALSYAGLYTARNTTVIYRDIHLQIEGQDEPPIELGDWQFSAFGGNTSELKNPAPAIQDDGSVTLFASGGKIAANDEGMSFYYREVPADANFEWAATATVKSFNSNSTITTPGQKSFGIMLRDQVGQHGDPTVQTTSYVAVGALDTVMKGFYKQDGQQTKLNPFQGVNTPAGNEVYDLKIKKSGNTYVITANGQSETVILDALFNETIYAGFYVARDAEVTFSNFDIQVDSRKVRALQADTSAMKTTYLVGEALDLTGLRVKAVYSDGREEELSRTDYIVTGFDSSRTGNNTITLHYNGVTTNVELTVSSLAVTSLEVQYFPAKTVYYPGDFFDPKGLTVIAEYNNGYQRGELAGDQYTLEMEQQPFLDPGTVTVTVRSKAAPEVFTTFDVRVKDAEITALEIKRMPEKTFYFIDEEIDLDGLVVYAKYSDQTEARLMREDFAVSPLDTSVPGEQTVTISYQGKTVALPLIVKVKEAVRIEVTAYPKTTYLIGEAVQTTGLAVAKVYDNGERQPLAASQYTLDSSAFDLTAAGTYPIRIIPVDTALAPIEYKVTVREQAEAQWNMIRFGQSTTTARNFGSVKPDGSVELVALEGGGKVTGDHDGITFYYTELDARKDNFVLSADIQVKAYAKDPHDGQEAFGIMARDAIGTHGNSAVFASNIAAVGGFSGKTFEANGTQFFIRTGVESSDGAGSQGVQNIILKKEKPALSNTHPAANYKLTLAKTNSGYTAKLNNGEEAIFYEPELLQVQDGKLYLGFFVARLATIEVSNIQLSVTEAATDSPRVDPPQAAVAPQIEVVSLSKTSNTHYDLLVKPNVNGTVSVKQGQQLLVENVDVQAGQRLAIPAVLAKNSQTNFSVTFLPDDTQYLTSYDKIVSNFTVTMKTFMENGDIYVSPTGTGTGIGTVELPLNLDTAIDYVQPGQKIILLDGRYVRSSMIDIKKYNDGLPDAKKYLVAAPGARPVIDFDKKSTGVVLSGNYWHVKGIDFTRTAGNTKGFTIGGSYNIVEDCRFYENGDTGLQISRTDDLAPKPEWPSHNLILNSTSFDNRDPSDNNADGFAAKLTSGVGNIFRGCIAHNNIDDGWDLYTKAGTGAIGAVLIEDSIAYNNGFLTDGTVGSGDKNGFKLGGEGIHVPHVIQNSIAFGNGAYGFTSNSNPGVIAIDNIGFNNAGGNLSFTTYSHIPTDFAIDGFVSYQKDYTARDSYPAALQSDRNYMFNGTVSVNKSGVVLTDNYFISLEPVTIYARDEQGNIIWGDFLKVKVTQEPDQPEDETEEDPADGDGTGNKGNKGNNGNNNGNKGNNGNNGKNGKSNSGGNKP